MKMKAVDLPGIGKKITFFTASNNKVVLVVHHSGVREMYFYSDINEDESDFCLDLTADETREMGAQLLGATYQPVDMDRMRLFRNQVMIEWIEVSPNSPLANKTIVESNVRENNGVTIIGIIRNDEMHASPEPSMMILPKDTLMVIGKSEQVDQFTFVCKGV